jgi:hypothetical protein
MNKIEIGVKFEKEAFKILKKKFKNVKWLSKGKRSTFDFLCDGKFIEAKCSTKKNKIMINMKQQNADYIIFKNKFGIIYLVPKEEFNDNFYLEKEIDYKDKSKDMKKQRLRKIIKYGNTWVIKLESSDVKDFELVEGDQVDIDDLNLLECKEVKQ